MIRRLLLLLLFSSPALAGVPLNQCNQSIVGGSSTTVGSCNIASIGARHSVVIVTTAKNTGGTVPSLTFTATDGNTITLPTDCDPLTTPCSLPAYYRIHHGIGGDTTDVVIAYSTVGFSGSDTFTVTAASAVDDRLIWVGEYAEDFLGLDNFPPNSTITTTLLNDVVLTIEYDLFGSGGCSTPGTPPTGYTVEFGPPTGNCMAISDKIDVPPGTYNLAYTPNVSPTHVIAFGVAPAVAIRRRSQVY